MPLFDHFSILAPFYERAIPLRNPERLVELASLPVDGLLLDAGGGTGRVAKGISALATGIVVADLSMGMLRQVCLAQFVDCDSISPVNCPSERLPFPDETFARILMIDALHHVNDQPHTIAELWRVLKPGGRIVIEEPDIRTFAVKFVALAEKVALMRSHFLSPPKIAALFTDRLAQTRIVRDGFNAWVIVEKLRS